MTPLRPEALGLCGLGLRYPPENVPTCGTGSIAHTKLFLVEYYFVAILVMLSFKVFHFLPV